MPTSRKNPRLTGREPSIELNSFVQLVSESKHLEASLQDAGTLLQDSIRKTRSDAGAMEWLPIYESAVTLAEQVTEHNAQRLGELEQRYDRLGAFSSLPSRGSFPDTMDAARQSGEKILSESRHEWRDRMNRQREYLWDEKISRLLGDFRVAHTLSGRTGFSRPEEGWRRRFLDEARSAVASWTTEVSAGVYKRFMKKFNSHCAPMLKEAIETTGAPDFQRPMFEVDVTLPVFESLEFRVPSFIASLGRNLRSTLFMVTIFLSAAAAALGTDKTWIMAAIAPFLIGIAYLLARHERCAAISKHEADAEKILAAQADKSVKEYLSHVQRHLEREAQSQLGRYADTFEMWREEQLENALPRAEEDTAKALESRQPERTRLWHEISSLKVSSTRWQAIWKNLVARSDMLKATE